MFLYSDLGCTIEEHVVHLGMIDAEQLHSREGVKGIHGALKRGKLGAQVAIGQATRTNCCCEDNHGSTHDVYWHGTHGINNVTNWECNTRAHKLAMHITLMFAVWHVNMLMQSYHFSSKLVRVHSMTIFIPVRDQI